MTDGDGGGGDNGGDNGGGVGGDGHGVDDGGSVAVTTPPRPIIPTKERHPCENRGWKKSPGAIFRERSEFARTRIRDDTRKTSLGAIFRASPTGARIKDDTRNPVEHPSRVAGHIIMRRRAK